MPPVTMTDLQAQIDQLQAKLDRQWLVLSELHEHVLQQQQSSATPATPRQSPELGSDLELQRLNAQLTAAYGRIAALEDQLLNQSPRLQYR